MHYLLALLVPPLVLAAGARWGSTAKRLFVLAAVSAGLMYVITVGSAFALSAWYAYQGEAFDKDKDGAISLTEQSQEQNEAMERLVNDAGRNMTVFLAIPWSIAVSSVFFLGVRMLRVTKRSPNPRRGCTGHQGASAQKNKLTEWSPLKADELPRRASNSDA